MLDKIKRLGKETAIYGISTILGRFLNFFLVPFYTNVLPTSEYGIVAYVYALIAFVNVVYGYGMESAYFKYSSTKEIGTDRQNFTTPFLSLVVSSALASTLIVIFSSPVASLVALPANHAGVVSYTALILLFDTVAIVPFASLRMEGKAMLFAALKFMNIVINVAANLILLLVFHQGIEGIFLSGVIASVLTAVMLIPTIVRHIEPGFSVPLYRALLKFGLPYIPAGLATMMLQVVDRPVLRALTNDATVGVYQANYRLGIFMMLVVSMFDYAWRPFFLANAREPDAKQLFARVLTYVVLFMCVVFLVLSFFLPDLVKLRIMGRHLIHPDYWGGLSIVPVVLLAYLFLGIYNNLVAGIYIEKKTHHLPYITVTGAITNVAANFLLIPSLGMMGAAIATLVSYMVMAGVLYAVVQRFYPVQYEFGRLAKIGVALLIVFSLSLLVKIDGFQFGWQILLLVLFGILMYWMKFFAPSELRALRGLFLRYRPNDSAHGITGE